MNWKQYFEMMIDWKKLPAYKAEPRIDSMIGYYLKSILVDYLKVEIENIIPELPIRLGTVKPEHDGTNYADRSYKVDFFVIGANDINYLIEFKTDTKSRRPKQDEYLILAKKLGTGKLIDGILKIADVSSYKAKYDHLKDKLIETGLSTANFKYSGNNNQIEIIYVQPSNYQNEDLVIDFKWIADWLDKNYRDEPFEKEFATALRIWAND